MSGQPARATWDHLPLGVVAKQSLDVAARETPAGGVLETGRVFLTLARVDVHQNWSRFWLRTGYPPANALVNAHDSAIAAGVTWSGVAVSVELARALALAGELSARYGMSAIIPGALALSLLANPDCAATRTLLAGREIAHHDLLQLVQEELLGTNLEGLPEVLAQPRESVQVEQNEPWSQRASAIAESRAPDDLDLLTALSSAGEIDAKSNGPLIAVALEALTEEARSLGTHTADDVTESARTHFGNVVEPTAQQLIFALADRPSSGLRELLAVAGVSPRQLAIGAIERIEPAEDNPKTGVPVLFWTILNMGLMFTAIALIVRDAVITSAWWELAFLPGVFWGPPAVTAWFPAVVSAGLAAVNPLAGLALALEAGLSWVRERAERRALTARTGVRLTLAEYRKWLRRRRYPARQLAKRDERLMQFRSMRLLRRAGAP